MQKLIQNPAISTRDAGISIDFGDKILWIFGDTIMINQDLDAYPMLSLTAGYSAKNQPFKINDINSSVQQFVNFTDEELQESQKMWAENKGRLALWPMSAVKIKTNQAVLFIRKLKIGNSAFDYTYLSTEIVTIDQDFQTSKRSQLFSSPWIFGDASLVFNNFLYLFGCFQNKVYVCRTKPEYYLEPNSYHFFDGNGWTDKPEDAAAIFDGPSSDFGICYHQSTKKFLAVYSAPMSNNIKIMASSDITKGWTKLDDIETTNDFGQINYAAQIHPELSTAENELLITYYQPKSDIVGDLIYLKKQIKI